MEEDFIFIFMSSFNLSFALYISYFINEDIYI